ncbi:penicillin-binding protein [Candidatus Microgenomates bacterium]|nr:MAG: penicillin-binding protein [Candidatus Microgenomates bacterium]
MLDWANTAKDLRIKKIVGGNRQQRLTRIKFLTFLATGFLVLLVIGIVGAGTLFAWYAKDLPRPDRVRRTEGLSTIIYDRNEKPIYDIYRDENRIPVSFDEIPQMLKDATVSVEDKEFYTHEGYSTMGMLRSIVQIAVYRNLQGGSTLTQQLVKNVLLTQERTVPRKIKEFILAIQIERNYTKDEILQMYLNESPYGGTTYGIEAAAQYYFDKKAQDLTPIESIILAGFPQSPSSYSPFTGGPDAYRWRSEQVIRRLREDGKITKEEEEEFKTQLDTVEFSGGENGFEAAHFVNYIKELLVQQFDRETVEEGGLRVVTTLDLDLQKEAEEIVKEEVEKVENLKVSNGAAVILDPNTGEILALVGSKDYEASDSAGAKFNVVTQALRQPGSALKPITYAQAFKEGYTPSSIIMDVETEFPGGDGQPPYKPKNYDLKWRGPVQMRYALANSINMSAVKTVALVGVEDMLQLSYDMGLSTLEPTKENMSRFGLSVTLGGGEVHLLDLTQSYGVFATGGIRQEPVAILKVTDQKGKTLFEYKKPQGRRVLGEDVAYLITNILSDNQARGLVFGPNSYLNIPGRHVFVKTGTTDDKRDNWTVGGSVDRVVGVWVGNNDNSPMNEKLASGVTGAAPIWNRLIKAAIAETSDQPFKKPDNIVEMEIDAFGGGLPRSEFPTRKEVFIKGTEPTGLSPVYKKLKISKSTGKLANAIEIASGSFDEKEFIVFEEKDVVSADGKNRWQEGINKWIEGQTDPKYHPPTETSSEKQDDVIMNINDPQDQRRYDDHDVKIAGEAFSLGKIKEIIVRIDGNEMDKVTDTNSYSRVFNLNTGPHTIQMTARDDRGKEATGRVQIGVNSEWDAVISPSPSPSPTPVASP